MHASRGRWLLTVALALGGCSSTGLTSVPPSASNGGAPSAHPSAAATASPSAAPSPPSASGPRTILFDTDVAGDDLVALAFLLSVPTVDLVGVTVSGTGEAHCAGGVDVVLRLLDALDAPDIPVACGHETPLSGTHTFPDEWRTRVDAGSGLTLPATARSAADSTAVELIKSLAGQHDDLVVLATGPITNLAEALLEEPGLGQRLRSVYVMGGALHVPGNLVCCGAPEGNAVAEWNVYVDPKALQVVVDSGVLPFLVSLDGTSQVPLTPAFAARLMEPSDSKARKLVTELFTANPFMIDGSFYLWDPLAAQVAAGYPVGSFLPAAIEVEQTEGPESGFTRPIDGEPNVEYMASADAAAAEATLLAVLTGS